MKKLVLPLEQHNIFEFQASTCPEGVKYFFEKNNYLLLRNLFKKDDKINLIEKKVSNAIMQSVYASFDGNYELICQINGDSKIILDNQYLDLNKGDGFFFVKNEVKFKLCKKLLSKSSVFRLSFLE